MFDFKVFGAGILIAPGLSPGMLTELSVALFGKFLVSCLGLGLSDVSVALTSGLGLPTGTFFSSFGFSTLISSLDFSFGFSFSFSF